LGTGSLEWLPGYPDSVIAFVNNGVAVMANAGDADVALPEGDIMVSSGEVSNDVVAPDTTAWVILPS